MNRYDLEKRLRELSIYSTFFTRKELKALPQLLKDQEQLNCILTGVHEANRKMLAVTDQRLIIIFAGALSAGQIKVIRRDAVTDYRFEKKFPFSRVRISVNNGEEYVFENTQGSLKELFEWAMQRPLPSAD